MLTQQQHLPQLPSPQQQQHQQHHHHPLFRRHNSRDDGKKETTKKSSKDIAKMQQQPPQQQQQQMPQAGSSRNKHHNSPTTTSSNNNNNNNRKIHFLDALTLVQVSPNLLQSPGMPVLRVEANGRTIASFLRLAHDKFTVTLISEEKASLASNMLAYMACKSSPADVRDIDIGEMDRIQRGQATQQFEKAKQKTANKNNNNNNNMNNNNNNNSEGGSVGLRKGDLLRSASYSSRNSNGNNNNNNNNNNITNTSTHSTNTSCGSLYTTSAAAAAVLAADATNGTTTTISSTGTRIKRAYSNKSPGASLAGASTIASPASLGEPSHRPEQQQQQQQQHPPGVLDPNRSFSIIFRGAHTLDMMAMSMQERNEICDSLDRILSAYQRAKVRVADDVRLLRHVWIDVVQKHHDKHHHHHNHHHHHRRSGSGLGGDGGGGDDGGGGGENNKLLQLNERQVAKVFLQINFSMKTRDLQSAYDHFGKVIGLHRSARRKGLTFEQLADFLHYVRRNQWMVKPVTVIWNGLFGEVMKNGKQRETVSDKTFADKFLYATQHQHSWTMTDVRKLFRLLHDMEISHRKTTTATGRGGVGAAAIAAADGGGFVGGLSTDLNRINKDQFEAFLLSPSHNEAFDPEKERHRVSDMDRPLSEYFINSSHNTYLVGDQYTSQSSVEMYSNALYRGCRCLELDIWDGPAVTDNKTGGGGKQQLIPVIWHGHTMTTKIFFSDIIQCVKVFLNFHPTEYPIILSFENHCSIPYQKVLAEELIRILGDSLYIPTEASLNGKLPSPLQLRGRVVIKGRRPNKKSSSIINDGTINLNSHAEVECSYEEYDMEGDSDDGCVDGEPTRNSATSATCHTNDTRGLVIKEVPPAPASHKSTKPNVDDAITEAIQYDVAPELARLTLFHGQKYKNWDESMASPTFCMHSFSENQIRAKVQAKVRAPTSRSSKLASSTSLSVSTGSTATTSHRLFSIYNQTHMTRIYPAGSRVDSSNYNPLLAWSTGCQMVVSFAVILIP
jgi:uncharacterized membrane protein YgcG